MIYALNGLEDGGPCNANLLGLFVLLIVILIALMPVLVNITRSYASYAVGQGHQS
jgi:hypothetical protein